MIDVGTSSKEETESLEIEIGNPVVPDVLFESLNNDELLLGQAFDNRIGTAALLETMKKFAVEVKNHSVSYLLKKK